MQLLSLFSTFLLYFYADVVDPSKSERVDVAQASPAAFSRVPTNRSSSENALLTANIITSCFGIMSIYLANGTGLSIYCLTLVGSVFFGVTSTAYFLYFFRWCLDIISLYIALVIRNNRVVNYAILHLRRR